MIAFVAATLALLVAAADDSPAPATSPGNVPEPSGIYQGPMHGYTPSTLKGGIVIDTAALATLIKDKNPILIDVAEADRKPAGLPASSPWRPRHRAIPDTVWMPGAGHGNLTAAAQAAFDKRVAALANGDKSKAIVTYCHPDCWGSWNAGKRLILAGYRNVFWLPSGIEGWQEDHPTQVVQPDAAWTQALPSAGEL